MKFGLTPTQTALPLFQNHSGDMPEGTLKAILRQADINVETFLDFR